MKKILPIGFAVILLSSGAMAQTNDSIVHDAYGQYRQQAIEEYRAFQQQARDEFQRFLNEAWTSYQCFKGSEAFFAQPKPDSIPTFGEVSENQLRSEQHEAPITNDWFQANEPDGNGQTVSISFYGCRLRFALPAALGIKAKGTREKQVAQYYAQMSEQAETQPFLKQIEGSVRRMGLNDWGYFTLLRSISEKAFADMNDRVLFCFFMLRQEGFRARIGREQQSGQLKLLIAIDNAKEVYSLSFYRFNGVKYYSVYGGTDGADILSYNEKADDKGLKEFSLDFKRTLNMAACDKTRTLTWGKDKATLTLSYCTSHLRYLDDMPLTVLPVYCKSALPQQAQDTLDSYFGPMKQSHSQAEMVEILLHFVQNAFQYKIDEKQFGREKYFFPEEVIAYPYSDCEDRCALFTWLVRRYTNCEVIGVLYPDHLATGVCFGNAEAPKGQGLRHNGKYYLLCDPTYPNAPIGTVLPQLKSVSYEIVKIG